MVLFPKYIDHQFHLCTENLGSDTCTPCDKGQINPDEIHTKKWSYEHDGLCHVPDCDCSVPGDLFLRYKFTSLFENNFYLPVFKKIVNQLTVCLICASIKKLLYINAMIYTF